MSNSSKDYVYNNIDVFDHVPEYLKNELNSSFSRNLFNKFLTKDESIPVFGLAGNKTANDADTRPLIPQDSYDRKVNALIPMIYAKSGTEETLLSFSDVINKAKLLGINVSDFSNWGACQSFNYVPPIDIDKFINFSSYYWTGKLSASPNKPKWNEDLDPEYYVIARPSASNKNKFPAEITTSSNIVLTGSGHVNESWIVTFLTSYEFTVEGETTGMYGSGVINEIYGGEDNGSRSNPFVSFMISGGTVAFAPGDRFVISTEDITDNYTFEYSGVGNGGLSGVSGAKSYQLDSTGKPMYAGQRILVKNQTNKAENGVYVVSPGVWTRASDCTGSNATNGVTIFVTTGTPSQIGLWTSGSWTNTVKTFSRLSFDNRNVTEWSEFNFWVHRDDAASLGIDINETIQAKRPIIEYDFALELNTDAVDGVPAGGNNVLNALQHKTKFNQLPLFNLYLANGEFANKVSALFYYEEDSTASVDKFMKRRIKLDVNSDYIFSQGCVDDGIMLFFKKGNVLSSMWAASAVGAEKPRYVAGETLSTAVDVVYDEEGLNGTWTTPFQLEYNTYHENRKSVSFGDLINHFKSIISHQVGFEGSSFGRNNFRTLTSKNFSLGGKIKEHNGAFNKFIGLSNLENISLVSILDFAETQYAQALNSVGEYVNKCAIDFLSTNGTPEFVGNVETSNKIKTLVSNYCEYYKNRVDVASYLSSSTSVIPNWPATLPALGLATAVAPHFSFDNDLGLNVIVHHDGHLSPKNQRNIEFDRGLTKQLVTRSDGTTTAGVFSSVAPNKPYAYQLWFNSTTGVLKIFNVANDKEIPSLAKEGDAWYDRDNDEVYTFTNLEWVQANKADFWVTVETDKILNAAIIELENMLYASIHPEQKIVWDSSASATSATLEYELAKYSAKYGIDPYSPEYVESDAFTWNYKQATFPLIGSGTAKWYDIYFKYFKAATGTQFSTNRPNIEPWKLFGHDTKPFGFDQAYAGTVQASSQSLMDVSVILVGGIGSLFTCPNIVDGKTLEVGERVAVTSGAHVGVYTVSVLGTGDNGKWVYSGDFNPMNLTQGLSINVKNGAFWNSTKWALVYVGTGYEFQQVRTWSMQMWADLQHSFPALKLCVNVFNEQLLPPYVDPLSTAAQFALTTVVPSGTANAYVFGDNGPTESVWKKSLEYTYSLLRAGMKNQPLKFIEDTWGDVYRSVNGLKLDKQAGRKLSHQEFILHSESISEVKRARIIYSSLLTAAGFSGEKSVEMKCDYVTDEKDFFKVSIDGIEVGYLHQLSGEVSGIDFTGFSLTDSGRGFEIGDILSFTVSDTSEISNVLFTPAKSKVIIGIGQWFTQLMQFNSYSLTQSKNNTLFRKWDVNLGYRFGAFMNTDTLRLSSDSFDIPLGMCKMLTKVSPYASSSWLNAIRIQLVQVGSTQLVDGVYKPINKGEDWSFRIETYFSKHPQISYYEVDTDGEFMTFNALENRRSPETWKNFSRKLSVKTSTTPIIITGIQNVANFLFGYTMFLQDSGWKINSSDTPEIDSETGRLITWQLEIEKFIDAAYNSMSAGSGVIIDPFMKNVWFAAPKGLVSKFETINFLDVSASQFAFDVAGNLIPVDQLKVLREEDTTTIISDTPMFGVHLNVEHYEHSVLFPFYLDNNKKQKLIFDPFLGLKLKKILVQGRRQAVQSARPSFGGFYLNNNQMKRNIVSSIDDLGNLYDAETVFDNPEISKYALALFGFSNKDYFTDLGTSKKTQFNFWRGMIQAKGTNSSVDSFLNNKVYQDAKIDEYWAFKVAEYGDARTKSFPELKLSATDSLLDTTRFQFAEDGSAILPGFTQILSTDADRWLNLDDLNELKNRGMYFDAISLGKIVVNEKPQIKNLQNLVNGEVVFVSGKQIVKTFMTPTVITCTMTDFDSFIVKDSSNAVYGTGTIGQLFSCSAFEFYVENGLVDVSAGDKFSFEIADEIFSIVKLPFISDKIAISNPSLVDVISQGVVAIKKANTSITIEGFGPQKPKFSPIKLFDYQSDTFIGNIPFWHPAVGQHTPEAFEIINIVSPSDPAKYNETTQTLNNPNFDLLKPWGSKEVGKVWWNTKKLDYIPYYDASVYPDIENRLSKWGSAAEYSSVEVYEWVESNVSPEKYNAAVLSDAKDPSIPQEDKKSGTPAIDKLLTRSRTWNARPIAWKKNEITADSPFFTSALFNKIFITASSIGTSTAILNFGKFSDYSITEGMSLSAWDFINDIPVGQAKILNAFDYVIGGEFDFFPTSSTSLLVQPSVMVGGVSYQLSLSVDKSSKQSSIGKALGKIKVVSMLQDGLYYINAIETNSGKSQKLPSKDLRFDQIGFVDFDFTDLGIKLRLTSPSISLSAEDVAQAIGNELHDIFVREAVSLDVEIGFPGDSPVILVNDQSDSSSFTHPYGWRAWVNPTQADLDADLKAPNNLWEPVYGDFSPVTSLNSEYLKRIKEYQESKLVLNNSTIVEKYEAVWSDFTQLSDVFSEVIFDGNEESKVFAINTSEKSLVKSRVFAYINGILQPASAIAVSKLNVTLLNSNIAVGSKLVVIYKKYSPTAEELAFDPETADDILTNTQYKFGYDFTSFEIRDSNDKLSSTVYYFWVKNKNTAPKNRKMSVQQAKNLLTYGPSLYMTFHNPIDANASLPVRYDSVSIFGLNKYANRNDTYKLRFTRNFTLRDDPVDLDLKNVHAEWQLLRPAQNVRIPSTLWEKLVDSAVGADIVGNSLPYVYLQGYDDLHGTSNRFGLGQGQVLSEKQRVIDAIKHTILNTTLTINLGGAVVPDYVQNLKLSQLDKYFDTPESIRKTLDFIWREAKPKQINEIFFAVINDALANNFEFKDVFKTSRLSVYSIKTVGQILTGTSDE